MQKDICQVLAIQFSNFYLSDFQLLNIRLSWKCPGSFEIVRTVSKLSGQLIITARDITPGLTTIMAVIPVKMILLSSQTLSCSTNTRWGNKLQQGDVKRVCLFLSVCVRCIWFLCGLVSLIFCLVGWLEFVYWWLKKLLSELTRTSRIIGRSLKFIGDSILVLKSPRNPWNECSGSFEYLSASLGVSSIFVSLIHPPVHPFQSNNKSLQSTLAACHVIMMMTIVVI